MIPIPVLKKKINDTGCPTPPHVDRAWAAQHYLHIFGLKYSPGWKDLRKYSMPISPEELHSLVSKSSFWTYDKHSYLRVFMHFILIVGKCNIQSINFSDIEFLSLSRHWAEISSWLHPSFGSGTSRHLRLPRVFIRLFSDLAYIVYTPLTKFCSPIASRGFYIISPTLSKKWLDLFFG
jgi:hypothetical protein